MSHLSRAAGQLASCLSGTIAGTFVWLAFGPWAAATALPTAPLRTAPAAWVAYAGQASKTLSGWLSSDEPTAKRLRDYLDGMRPAPDQPPPPVQLAIWIDRDGTLTKVEGALFTQPQPQADLHALLVGHRLPARPPADMLQPVRIQLRLEAAPPAQAQSASGGAAPSP